MIGLIDSTLREGEQMAGVYFSLAQKLEIISCLGLVGVEEIEIGVASSDPDMPQLMKQARDAAPNSRFALWSRCLPKDILCAANLMPDVLSLSMPVSDLHIHKRLRKDHDWVLTHIQLAVSSARAFGIKNISLGLEDATRADCKFLESAFKCAVDAGVDRIRFSDTLGAATPAGILVLAQKFSTNSQVEVGIHTHNDFGMATANAITALDAGFDWADVSVLGLGERSGIARLEEVVAYRSIRKHIHHYDTRQLRSLCELVADIAQMRIYHHHPTIGEGLFACESGLHLDGLAKDTRTYEPYPPELVNGTRERALGKKSGSNALRNIMRDMGTPISSERAFSLINEVKMRSSLLGRPLTDIEIRNLLPGVQM